MAPKTVNLGASRRDDEKRAVLFAMLAGGLILFQQVGAKAARDALFLSSFPARELPKIMAGSAIVSLAVVLLSARAMARIGPLRFVPITLVVNALFFAAEAAASAISPAGTALMLYLHVAALGSVLISGFWSLVTERFDPHSARRLMGKIAVGATLGGALGGLAADAVARLSSARWVLVELCIASALAAFAARSIGVANWAPPSVRGGVPAGPLSIIRSTPYLRLLGALAALAALWAAMLDYTLKSEVSAAFTESNDLLRFFAWFYTATGILTFIVQFLLGDRVLRKHGIGLTVALLPLFVSAGSILVGVTDVFLLLVALRATESIFANSVHRASYELFFTPLPKAVKRPTKTIVDVAATRAGDAIGSGLILLALLVLPNLPTMIPVFVAAAAALAAFALVPRLHRGYVQALTGALRAGSIKIDEGEQNLDALTRHTLAESTHMVDRGRLLEEIDAFRREQQIGQAPPAQGSGRGSAAGSVARTMGAGPGGTIASLTTSSASLEARFAATLDPLASTAIVLASRDADRIRSVLERPIDPELLPFVLPSLANRALAPAAEKAIGTLGARVVGALGDALFDPKLARSAKIRVARLIGNVGSARAREALFEGLGVDATPLRLACARALVHFSRAHPELAPDRERVFEAVTRAVERPVDGLDAHVSMPPPSAGDNVIGDGDAALSRLEPRIQIALTLLAATLEREGVELAARALASPDTALRGTALEYLDNVLEEPAKSALLRSLAAPTARVAKRRTERELIEELQRTKA